MPEIIDRTGETNTNNHGLTMTIHAYRKTTDIDVKFDDGAIVKNKTYQNFRKGAIQNPNDNRVAYQKKQKRLGETNRANNGQLMTIIAYRSAIDVDVQFENDEIVKNKTYKSFQDGNIKNETYKKYIGETTIANNGMKMTVIACRNYKDLDVEFETGEIRKNIPYLSFKNGELQPYTKSETRQQRIGQTNRANNGLLMTIIAYRRTNDIDVKFENDQIVKNKTYSSFLKGQINIVKERVHEQMITTNGMRVTIVNYQTSDNITVKFEDGMIAKNKRYSQFIKNQIGYPKQYQTLKIKSLAYHAKDRFAFYVKCKNCGLSDIMTYEQMQQHQCKHIA